MIKLPRPRPFSPAAPLPSRFPSLGLAAAAIVFLCGFVPAGRAAEAPAGTPSGSLRYGLVWLDVEPSPAEVSLDGEYLDTGVWLISVAPGNHELRVRKPGFRGFEERIVVPAGGNIHLEVRLLPGAVQDS